jgi:hypothetical protein
MMPAGGVTQVIEFLPLSMPETWSSNSSTATHIKKSPYIAEFYLGDRTKIPVCFAFVILV